MLTVCRTVANLASQMARLTVRLGRHGSMTDLCWPRACPAQVVVTQITVMSRLPSPATTMLGVSGQ
jgi:hypothetical protein